MNTELGTIETEPIYEKADIPSLAAALTIYVTAFSKPPFNEKWTVQEGDFNPEEFEDLNSFLINVLDKPQDLIINSIANDKQINQFRDIKFETVYPLNKIISSYAEALRDPEAVLLLKGNSNDIYRLSEGERINANTSPTAVARFVNYSPEKINSLKSEISSYLSDEDIQEVMNDLLDANRILYLAETVNLNENILQLGSFTRQSTDIYKEKYGKKLPDRVMYLTKPGTEVERNNGKRNLNRRFMKAIIERNYPKGTQFEHKRFTFTDFNGEDILIYLSKIDEVA
ncbi:MAG: hypothetical protein XD93_0164 [candidate division WS6 bacterium 34_10]|uniref:Uncharacterized protein n=1 Tax=candidate division WS6 bacterium 34_10 TaxID=1641389 RepID=A0A101HIW9_9BACT|nr:MAG: hypothetical protein XD93_0164 [candidate division WS6 bacterium 34_10]